MKMDEVRSSETLVKTSNVTRHIKPEDQHLNQNGHEDIKPHRNIIVLVSIAGNVSVMDG
jgi:hypothetical protein